MTTNTNANFSKSSNSDLDNIGFNSQDSKDNKVNKSMSTSIYP